MKPLVDVEFRFVPRTVDLDSEGKYATYEHVLQVRKCYRSYEVLGHGFVTTEPCHERVGKDEWTEWQDVPVLLDEA